MVYRRQAKDYGERVYRGTRRWSQGEKRGCVEDGEMGTDCGRGVARSRLIARVGTSLLQRVGGSEGLFAVGKLNGGKCLACMIDVAELSIGAVLDLKTEWQCGK